MLGACLCSLILMDRIEEPGVLSEVRGDGYLAVEDSWAVRDQKKRAHEGPGTQSTRVPSPGL